MAQYELLAMAWKHSSRGFYFFSLHDHYHILYITSHVSIFGISLELEHACLGVCLEKSGMGNKLTMQSTNKPKISSFFILVLSSKEKDKNTKVCRIILFFSCLFHI